MHCGIGVNSGITDNPPKSLVKVCWDSGLWGWNDGFRRVFSNLSQTRTQDPQTHSGLRTDDASMLDTASRVWKTGTVLPVPNSPRLRRGMCSRILRTTVRNVSSEHRVDPPPHQVRAPHARRWREIHVDVVQLKLLQEPLHRLGGFFRPELVGPHLGCDEDFTARNSELDGILAAPNAG